MTCRVSAEEHDRIKVLAERDGRTVSNWLKRAALAVANKPTGTRKKAG